MKTLQDHLAAQIVIITKQIVCINSFDCWVIASPGMKTDVVASIEARAVRES